MTPCRDVDADVRCVVVVRAIFPSRSIITKDRSRWEIRARCRKSCPEVDGCPATAGLGRETSPSARPLRREFPPSLAPFIVSFLLQEGATTIWRSLQHSKFSISHFERSPLSVIMREGESKRCGKI